MEYFLSSSSWLPELLVENEDSKFDAFLYVGGTLVLKAHQPILSGSIPFFKRTFRSGMKEAETGEVNFKDTETSADSLKALVCAVYGHKLVIDAENVRDIHDTANFLEMDEISVKCAEFMVNNLNVDTVLASWEYAHLNFAGADKLLKGCEGFIGKHFQQVYRKTEFLKLEVGYISQLLSSSNLGVSAENDVVDALLSWLDHDWEHRFALIKEHSLLDLIFWDSVDVAVQQVTSLKALRNRGHPTDVAEKDALLMIYEKVTSLPIVAQKHSRVKGQSLYLGTTEAGLVYVVQKASNNTHSLFVHDTAMGHFFAPRPLKMPEGASHILGMVSHDSCAFLLLSGGPQYTESLPQLVLLELRNGSVKSKIDLILPPDVQDDDTYAMSAVSANSDKLCIGLRKGYCGIFKLLLVYDLSMQCLEPPKSEGSRGFLRCSHCITGVPETAVEERRDGKIAYTPGKIWVFQKKVISYDLNLKSWSKPLGIDYGLDAGFTMSKVLVAFDYIIIAFLHIKYCEIRMFNYRSLPNGDVIALSCSYASDYCSTVHTVSLATMGQQLLVYLSMGSTTHTQAFSVKLESDGKPSGELSRDESMNQFKHEHMLQII